MRFLRSDYLQRRSKPGKRDEQKVLFKVMLMVFRRGSPKDVKKVVKKVLKKRIFALL